jgi:ribosome-binding factor A
MYYEINIALNGSHFFATAKRSITCTEKLKEVLYKLKESFKKEDGYSISISYCPEVSYFFDITNIEDKSEIDEVIKKIGQN